MTKRKICLLALVLLFSPIWSFEALYAYGLWSLGERPSLQVPQVSRLADEILWFSTGERESSPEIVPLWVGNFFKRSRANLDGCAGARQVARDWFGHVQLEWEGMTRLRRVVAEEALTVWLSRHASASQLKQLLGETQYFGRGTFGLRAASIAYFDREAGELSMAEVALLAGLSRGPPALASLCHAEKAVKQRDYVLKRILAAGLVPQNEVEAALAAPITAKPRFENCICRGEPLCERLD